MNKKTPSYRISKSRYGRGNGDVNIFYSKKAFYKTSDGRYRADYSSVMLREGGEKAGYPVAFKTKEEAKKYMTKNYPTWIEVNQNGAIMK